MTLPSSQRIRIPADVEREDRVLANLTARQLAILAVAGLALYGLYLATRMVLPTGVFLVIAVPAATAAAVVALGSRDGLSMDRLLVAAVRQRMTPRVQVAAPEGLPAVPDWLTSHATAAAGTADEGADLSRPAELHLPVETVTDTGAIDLATDGVATVAVASTVNFALRTPEEQEALVATFGHYLHSLTAPIQILIRSQRLDLSAQISELREQAGGLPHPALEAAASEHADYLAQLAEQSDLLRRQVLLILREPIHASAAAGPGGRAWQLVRRRRRHTPHRDAARQAARTRLTRRLGEATALLGAAGIVVTPLDALQATAILAAACNPDTLVPLTAGLAAAEDVITAAGPQPQVVADTSPPHPTGDEDDPDQPRADGRRADDSEPAAGEDEMWWSR